MNRPRTGASSPSLLPADRKRMAKITQKSVKLCELCGTLNLLTNKECWTCRWHGDFRFDERTIELAWQRLEFLYEEVRVEHVTIRRSLSVGDFGTVRPAKGLRRLALVIAARWQRLGDRRDLWLAQRQARLQTRMPSPPDQLGV